MDSDSTTASITGISTIQKIIDNTTDIPVTNNLYSEANNEQLSTDMQENTVTKLPESSEYTPKLLIKKGAKQSKNDNEITANPIADTLNTESSTGQISTDNEMPENPVTKVQESSDSTSIKTKLLIKKGAKGNKINEEVTDITDTIKSEVTTGQLSSDQFENIENTVTNLPESSDSTSIKTKYMIKKGAKGNKIGEDVTVITDTIKLEVTTEQLSTDQFENTFTNVPESSDSTSIKTKLLIKKGAKENKINEEETVITDNLISEVTTKQLSTYQFENTFTDITDSSDNTSIKTKQLIKKGAKENKFDDEVATNPTTETNISDDSTQILVSSSDILDSTDTYSSDSSSKNQKNVKRMGIKEKNSNEVASNDETSNSAEFTETTKNLNDNSDSNSDESSSQQINKRKQIQKNNSDHDVSAQTDSTDSEQSEDGDSETARKKKYGFGFDGKKGNFDKSGAKVDRNKKYGFKGKVDKQSADKYDKNGKRVTESFDYEGYTKTIKKNKIGVKGNAKEEYEIENSKKKKESNEKVDDESKNDYETEGKTSTKSVDIKDTEEVRKSKSEKSAEKNEENSADNGVTDSTNANGYNKKTLIHKSTNTKVKKTTEEKTTYKKTDSKTSSKKSDKEINDNEEESKTSSKKSDKVNNDDEEENKKSNDDASTSRKKSATEGNDDEEVERKKSPKKFKFKLNDKKRKSGGFGGFMPFGGGSQDDDETDESANDSGESFYQKGKKAGVRGKKTAKQSYASKKRKNGDNELGANEDDVTTTVTTQSEDSDNVLQAVNPEIFTQSSASTQLSSFTESNTSDNTGDDETEEEITPQTTDKTGGKSIVGAKKPTKSSKKSAKPKKTKPPKNKNKVALPIIKQIDTIIDLNNNYNLNLFKF